MSKIEVLDINVYQPEDIAKNHFNLLTEASLNATVMGRIMKSDRSRFQSNFID
jgi:hypothetical protein